MRNPFKRTRGSADCTFGFGLRQQVMLEVSGILTLESVVMVAADVERIAYGVQAKSIVIDLRNSLVALSYEELNCSPELLSPAIRNLPIALIAPSGASELLREHAWWAAQEGLLRGVFQEVREGHHWAHEKERRCDLYSRTPTPAK